ncbi:MAG TPA: Hpt domain-containing protein [Terracidiphilus sp.]|jgi:HPt (histidine-containing phosphotransfer) domain-containing protein|nr:Hpt domain-containing protein [Terracidiphilus sp.]
MANPAAIAEIMNQMWVKFLPDIQDRVAVLEKAAAAVSGGSLPSELREEAFSAAHKLAGILGTFGLDEGTTLAREAEALYAGDAGPVRDGRPAALANQIGAIVASRNA